MEQLRQNKTSPNNFPGADWQLLDDLDLPVGSYMDDQVNINVWLMEILSPLELHIDFFNRVLNSVQDAIVRTMQVVARKRLTNIHLLIFAPADRTPNGQIWGFFRIEKVAGSLVDGNPSKHSIELYLYLADK